MATERWWATRRLDTLDPDQWEQLCDGCAGCCLFKAESQDGTRVASLPVVCRYLDRRTQRCTCYAQRHEKVPDCVALTPARARAFHWLPETCAYRRRAAAAPLPEWHPLERGHRRDVPRLAERVLSESDIHPDELEAWIDAASQALEQHGGV